MKVTLIDFTGAGNPDPWYAARKLVYTKDTRLEQGADTRAKVMKMSADEIKSALIYIAGTIRSSWEFVHYTFEISGVTRAFTHQLVRTRTGSYAQQAQRVVNMSNFEALKPATLAGKGSASDQWDATMRAIGMAYRYLHDVGVPAQDCRGLLPTNVLTNIIAEFNLRTMADLLAKRKNARAQGEYADVAREMERCILEVHQWAEPFINPVRTRTPALDKLLKVALGSAGPLDKPELNTALKELDLLKATWG